MSVFKDRRITPEQVARAACDGLGYTEEQVRDFVDMHLAGEARRDLERERELGSAKRDLALTNAIKHAAMEPWCYAHKDFHEDNTPVVSRGFDAEDQRDADTYQSQRNRGET